MISTRTENEIENKMKELQRQYYNEYREKNKERINALHKQWRDNNKDRVKEIADRYWRKKALKTLENKDI